MAKTRIYIVQSTKAVDGKFEEPRLVDAVTPSQAVRHVTADAFTCTVATSHQVAKLVGKGIKLETANAEEEQTPLLPLQPPTPPPPTDKPADQPDDFGKGEPPKFMTAEEENAANAQQRRAHRKAR